MEFIALLLALLVFYYQKIPERLREDDWYLEWYSSLTFLPSGIPRLFVTLVLPVIGLDLLLRFVHGWMFSLPSLLIAVLALLYSFGRGDLRDELRTVAEDAEREDMQGVYHRIETLTPAEEVSSLDVNDAEALSGQAIKSLSYRFLEHMFAALFWFFVLGPAGALLYRLLWVSAQAQVQVPDQVADTNDSNDFDPEGSVENRLARHWLYWLEWLPVRALGLILAVVGNFSDCVEIWLESLVNTESSSRLLGAFVATSFTADAIDADLTEKSSDHVRGALLAARVRGLQPLFFRCVLAWLVFVAVLVVSF